MLNSKFANTFHESEMKETQVKKGQLIAFEEKWITNSHTVKKRGDLFEIYLFSGSIDQFDKIKKKIIEKLLSSAIPTMYHIYSYTHSQQIFI